MNTIIKIYKTDVTDKSEAAVIVNYLIREFPSSDVSFDLDDCDKVLRIETPESEFNEEILKQIFKKNKHRFETLPF